MDLISVIVPVFRVEAYLDHCLETIINQTYAYLEIILVDDGSTDRCTEMCDRWAEKDKRITVIHKKNGGLSDARNAGMTLAKGQYIAFVDSDDWIDPEMLSMLHDRIVTTDSDIASCGAVRVWKDSDVQQPMISVNGSHVLERTDAMRALIQSTCLIQTVWNKLYKASIIKRIPFEVGMIHEDEFWSWKVLAAADRVATIDNNMYFYLQRADGIMGAETDLWKSMLVIDAKVQRHEYIISNMKELQDIDSENLLYTCYHQGCQIMKYGDQTMQKDFFNLVSDITKDCKMGPFYKKQMHMKKRIRLFLIRYWLKWVCMFDVKVGLN